MKKIFFLFLMIVPLKICAVKTSAQSVVLMDMDNNQILYSKDIDEVKSVASISKIMTAVLAIESGKMDDFVIVGDEIKSSYGSAIYIKEGEKLTLRDLVYGLMLRSGNDASLSIAKYVGGSIEKFVSMMNDKAIKLNMQKTEFNNPCGLDEQKGNYSTARDMAILTKYAMSFSEYKKITLTKEYKLSTNKNSYLWKNKNKLLSLYKYTTGGKTGYTEIAKRTLVTTSSKNNINLVIVTLNDSNDWQDHINLYEYIYNNYEKQEILKKGKISIYNEELYNDYDLYIKNSFEYLINNNFKNNIILKYQIEKKTKIVNNDKIGCVYVYIGDDLVHSENIYLSYKHKFKKKNLLLKQILEWLKKIW